MTDLTRVALAAVGVLPWPETDVVQRLTRRSGAGTALKDLAENVLARIRAAAVEQGRVDVLLFLVRAENTSRALTGLAKDINDLQPAAGLVEETLRSLHNDLGSRRTTGAQRTAILRRLPLLRTERQVGAALGLCAFLDAEREFSALIACLDSEQVLSLPDQVWAEVVGGLRRPAREHLAVVAESEAFVPGSWDRPSPVERSTLEATAARVRRSRCPMRDACTISRPARPCPRCRSIP